MELGRWLVALGLVLVFAGLALLCTPRLFAWFGHLPGDIRIEKDGVRVYIPITSALLLSLLLTLVLNLIGYLFALFSRGRP